jgi:hypothetical protein
MVQMALKRKLTAILSADVEGYSRLMDDDESATVRTLTSYRAAITDHVQQLSGRVVDSPGDNILAEFTSVVDAVGCAVEIQRVLAEQNAKLPDEHKMQFRIGVNLGDVIDEKDRTGLRFFYNKVIENPVGFNFLILKVNKKLPSILTQQQVWKLINTPNNLKHRLILMTTYSAGLRAKEMTTLPGYHLRL